MNAQAVWVMVQTRRRRWVILMSVGLGDKGSRSKKRVSGMRLVLQLAQKKDPPDTCKRSSTRDASVTGYGRRLTNILC